MELEVFVPVPPERLRDALADPARVARAVPGLQRDAGTRQPIAGRLKVRVAGHTITYRGELRLTAREDGSYEVEGDATEARGGGSVKPALTLRVTGTEGGSTLVFGGTATAGGRITELPDDAVGQAVSRLLSRFAERLGELSAGEPEPDRAESPEATEGSVTSSASGEGPESPGQGEGEADREDADADEVTAEDAAAGEVAERRGVQGGGIGEEAADADAREAAQAEAEEQAAAAESASVFETEVPPPSLDPLADDDFTESGEPPAEAAHARRTMIGRSAEEVDHAPPRGRYAPVPAPETIAPNSTLRWAAPAAALVVASAIVVGRALRRRR